MEPARKFKIIVNSKECGTCSGPTPSAVAKKVVKKLCGTSSKVVKFSLKECKRGCERVCGPYQGRMEKLDKPYTRSGKKITHRVVCGKVKKMRGGRELVLDDFKEDGDKDFKFDTIGLKPYVFFHTFHHGGGYYKYVFCNNQLRGNDKTISIIGLKENGTNPKTSAALYKKYGPYILLNDTEQMKNIVINFLKNMRLNYDLNYDKITSTFHFELENFNTELIKLDNELDKDKYKNKYKTIKKYLKLLISTVIRSIFENEPILLDESHTVKPHQNKITLKQLSNDSDKYLFNPAQLYFEKLKKDTSQNYKEIKKIIESLSKKDIKEIFTHFFDNYKSFFDNYRSNYHFPIRGSLEESNFPKIVPIDGTDIFSYCKNLLLHLLNKEITSIYIKPILENYIKENPSLDIDKLNKQKIDEIFSESSIFSNIDVFLDINYIKNLLEYIQDEKSNFNRILENNPELKINNITIGTIPSLSKKYKTKHPEIENNNKYIITKLQKRIEQKINEQEEFVKIFRSKYPNTVYPPTKNINNIYADDKYDDKRRYYFRTKLKKMIIEEEKKQIEETIEKYKIHITQEDIEKFDPDTIIKKDVLSTIGINFNKKLIITPKVEIQELLKYIMEQQQQQQQRNGNGNGNNNNNNNNNNGKGKGKGNNK